MLSRIGSFPYLPDRPEREQNHDGRRSEQRRSDEEHDFPIMFHEDSTLRPIRNEA
jgi:hypothetical protein